MTRKHPFFNKEGKGNFLVENREKLIERNNKKIKFKK